jgi:hypothetical protein
MKQYLIDYPFLGTIKGLTGSEIKILVYMLQLEDQATGLVHLSLADVEHYSKQINTSSVSTYNALKTLIAKNVILRLGFGDYSIQHNLIKLTEAK